MPWPRRALSPRAMPTPPLGTVPPKKPSRWVLLLQGAARDLLHAPEGQLPPLGTSLLSAPQGTLCIPVHQRLGVRRDLGGRAPVGEGGQIFRSPVAEWLGMLQTRAGWAGLVTCAQQAESACGLLTWAVTSCGFGVWHRVSVACFSLAFYTYQEDFAPQSPLVAPCPSVSTRAGWTPRPLEWSLSSCTLSSSLDPVAMWVAGLGGDALHSSRCTGGALGVPADLSPVALA